MTRGNRSIGKVPTPNSGRFGESAADVAALSLSPARGGMQTYDAFAARVTARGDGFGTDQRIASSDDRRSNPPPSTSRDAARLATLPECYDAYVSLHRSGLWFDVNPFWHPELRCYYLRCEPAKVFETTKPSDDDVRLPRRLDDKDKRTSGNGRRSRAVIVPVAVRVGRTSHATLRRLSCLGDAWRRESFRDEEDRKVSPKETPRVHERLPKEKEEEEKEDLFRGDAVCEIGVSLCVVDGDGTAVVLRVSSGLVEPEDVDPPAEDAVDLLADDFLDAGDGGSGNAKRMGFSDDEEEDLDERDAGEVGGAERETRDPPGPERLLEEEMH